MNKIYQELKKVGVFYISTMDQDQPRVRPFGVVSYYDEKCYFCTNNTKEVYKQLILNPKIEITALYPHEGECWMRLQAKAVRDNRREARIAMLQENPQLRQMYSEDDGIFEVFYLEDAHCIKYSFVRKPIIIQ